MFRKKSYSDLEVQEILQLLNLEKKKVSELSAKLKNSPQSEESATPSKGKETQLEVVVQFMRTRLDEAQGENLVLQNKIAEAHQQILRHQMEIEQHLSTLEIEKRKNEEFFQEDSALKAQFTKLKEQIKILEEDKKSWDAKTGEVELLKDMMMKTVQESGDLKELLKNKEEQVQVLTLDLENKSSSLNQMTEDLQTKNTAHHELTKFTEDLQSKLIQAEEGRQQSQESLKKKEELIEHLSSQVASLNKSLAEQEEAFQNIIEERHEHESCLRAAQNHLAKKVREAALLAEKYEGAQKTIQQLEKEKEASSKKLSELQALMDAELQHKLKVQEQHQDILKTVEAQSAKWEEKYFKLHDKWQEVEGKNRELKRLEERFSKMQIAFTQFNQLFAAPFTFPQTEEMPMKSFAEMETVPVQEKSVPFIQPSLFQTQKAPPRYKETLFG